MVLSFKPDLVQISSGSDYKEVTTVVIYNALNKVIHQRKKELHDKHVNMRNAGEMEAKMQRVSSNNAGKLLV